MDGTPREKNQQQFTCLICENKFMRERNLTQHIHDVHEGRRPFCCDICEKNFAQKSSLTLHTRNVHEEVKPFQCLECDRAFSQKARLQYHMNSKHRKKEEDENSISGRITVESQVNSFHSNIFCYISIATYLLLVMLI
jgi:uncharacterized Zn-finger protein